MKAGITAYSVANAVRLIRTQWRGCVLLPEGDTDSRIFSRFMDPSNCRLEVAHGKDNALGALALLKNVGMTGVLTLVDKDCVLLDPSLLSNPDLIVTDTHDLETMMIQSPALDKVLAEFGSVNKLQGLVQSKGASVRDVLADAALPIGLLRLASLRHGLNLKFEGCDYGSFIDRKSLNVDLSVLATKIIDITRIHSLKPADLVQLLELEKQHGLNKWDVCCGHDLSAVMSIGLRKLIGSCNPSDVTSFILERSLRLAYEESYFKMTRVYRSLQAWERRNPPYRILL